MNTVNIPNKYGQGAIFAYSGLEGENHVFDAMVGTLLGDCVGMEIRTNTQRYNYNEKGECIGFDNCPGTRAFLYTDFGESKNIYYTAVTSDMITADVLLENGEKQPFSILAIAQNVFVVNAPSSVKVYFSVRGEQTASQQNGYTVYTAGGHTFGFAQKTNGAITVSVLTLGTNVNTDVAAGFNADYNKIIKERIEFYNNLPRPAFKSREEEMLYYKCFSIMRSMIYSPEGKAQYRWSTPDRYPHRGMWLWDTAFHTVGIKHLSCPLAEETLLSMLGCVREDGFLSHMVTPVWQSNITQPPTLAWAALELYNFGHNKEFLKKAFNNLEAYLEWDIKNRDINGNGLPEWVVGDDPYCRCDESGMDNTPRFDEATEMDCIDFAAFLANDANCLAKIAEALGYNEKAEKWHNQFLLLKQKINEILWDDEDKFYYDRKLSDNKFHKVKSVASFITLFAEVCTKETAAAMVEHLKNPKEFGTALPIPTVSADYKSYKSKDMFNGTVWHNFNFLVAFGLEKYGYFEEAAELRRKTMDTINYWYQNAGCVFEFYDSEGTLAPWMLARKDTTPQPFLPTLKMQSVRDFSWGAMFTIDSIINRK